MRIAVAVLATGLLGVAGSSYAAPVTFGARLGLTEGGYQNDSTYVFTELVSGNDQQFTVKSDNSWYFAYGLQTGFSAAWGDFFGDVAVEYYEVRNDARSIGGNEFALDRTDILATAGYLIGRHWSAFGGYRRGMQGEGAFDDETFSESGFFVGGGWGGFEIGPLTLGTSLAYNFSKAEDFPFPGDDFDYGGLSLKFSLSPSAAPQHSIQLRYQRFTGDDSPRRELLVDSDGDGVDDFPIRIDDVELTESYVQATYSYAFYF
jgi:hypothetical protein